VTTSRPSRFANDCNSFGRGERSFRTKFIALLDASGVPHRARLQSSRPATILVLSRLTMYYIMQNMRPCRAPFFEYAAWYETHDRTIDRTKIGEVLVSTVFRGIDHSGGVGPPLLFETRVIGSALDGESRWYATLGEAKCGHHEIVAAVRAGR
jgi:hypothetical protein